MKKNNFVAFTLIAVVMLLWVMHSQRTEQLRRQQAARERAARTLRKIGAKPDEGAEPGTETTPDARKPRVVKPAVPPRTAVTGGPKALERIEWTNRGACIEWIRLTKYHPSTKPADKEKPLEVMLRPAADQPFAARLPGTLVLRDPSRRFFVERINYAVRTENGADGGRRITYAHTADSALRIEKVMEPEPESYFTKVTVRLKNVSDRAIENFQYEIAAASRIVPRQDGPPDLIESFYATQRGDSAKYHFYPVTSAEKGLSGDKPVVSAGAANGYFAVALLPKLDADGRSPVREVNVVSVPDVDRVKGSQDKRTPNVAVWCLTYPVTLKPGAEVVHEYRLFAGPKDPTILGDHAYLEGVINYGWFWVRPISSLLDVLLRFCDKVTGNYGLAIMLLTLFVKLALHPLTRKSQISMHKLRRIQPLINELREKYQHDKERLAREQMTLMKQAGANPLTGCLPLFLQFPVFIGLFQMIRSSITLRHQGFLWMHDLSAPDTVGYIGTVPINIMPVLMTITWFLNSLAMPKPDDPQQRTTQKMMLFMPILFGFFLYNYAAGLALYWFTSSLLGSIEQKLIKRKIEKHHSAPVVLTTPASGPAIETTATPAGSDAARALSQPKRLPKKRQGKRKR